MSESFGFSELFYWVYEKHALLKRKKNATSIESVLNTSTTQNENDAEGTKAIGYSVSF